MSAKTKKLAEELPLPVAPRWTVTTVYKKQTPEQKGRGEPPVPLYHQLRFSAWVELTRRGEGGLEQLQAMAKFMNRQGMVPRRKIECAADAPNPDAFRQKLSGAPPPAESLSLDA